MGPLAIFVCVSRFYGSHHRSSPSLLPRKKVGDPADGAASQSSREISHLVSHVGWPISRLATGVCGVFRLNTRRSIAARGRCRNNPPTTLPMEPPDSQAYCCQHRRAPGSDQNNPLPDGSGLSTWSHQIGTLPSPPPCPIPPISHDEPPRRDLVSASYVLLTVLSTRPCASAPEAEGALYYTYSPAPSFGQTLLALLSLQKIATELFFRD